jgi:hypothetical protein
MNGMKVSRSNATLAYGEKKRSLGRTKGTKEWEVMSQESVEKFLGRLITDDDFRERVKRSFDCACRENGFRLSDEERTIIQNMDLDQFEPLANTLDGRIKYSRRSL